MDYRIGDWVKLKTLEQIKESVREIERYNEDCEWNEEEYDEFDEDIEPFVGKICIIEDFDDDDSSYEIEVPNGDTDETYWIHSDWVEPVKTYNAWVDPEDEQPKFKVGDDVTITSPDDNEPLYWNSDMEHYIGTTTTVTHVYSYGYRLEQCGNWIWPETSLQSAIVYQPF